MDDFKIYYFTPYALNKNLGAEYNHYMNLLERDQDWACFVDADVMFLTPDFGQQIHDIVKKYPNTGMFTATTNRVGTIKQRYKGELSKNPDIRYHKRLAMRLQKSNYDKVEDLYCRISGLIMVIQKKTWKKVKFPEGLLGVDYEFSNELHYNGFNILLMKGVYVLHYYRLLEGRCSIKHLE